MAQFDHPNVVRVLNFFRANETVYMVMHYESGHSLQEHIARAVAKGSRLSEGFAAVASEVPPSQSWNGPGSM